VTNLRVTEASDQKQNLVVAKLVRAFEKAKTSMEYLKARYDELGQAYARDYQDSQTIGLGIPVGLSEAIYLWEYGFAL
jgi:hypothetical protein